MKTTKTTKRRIGRPTTAAPKNPFAGMTRFAACITAALLLFAGCGKEKHDPAAEPVLTISPAKESIAFSAAATESYTFEVNTNQPVWFAQSDQTWCAVEMNAEAGTFTVSALPNRKTSSPPPATIVIRAGRAAEIKITVTQAGVNDPSLVITPRTEALEFSAEATEEYTFRVTTNQPSWTAESDQDWCRIAIDAEAGTFTVTAQPNEKTTSPEPATITVSAGEAEEIKIAVTQAGVNDPTLTISPAKETLEFSAEATEEYAFTVTTNQPSWTAESDQDWCRIAIDLEAGTFTVTATENTADTPPSPATITVTAGKAAPIEITARQSEKMVLEITPRTEAIEFSAKATEEFVFTVKTNQPLWTAESDQPWCLVAVDAQAGTFTVTATENTTTKTPAPATITVTAGRAAPLAITATQLPVAYDIYIAGYCGGVCYWKNGKRTNLTNATHYDVCSSITASGGSIYIAGTNDDKAYYWKDGQPVHLPGYYSTLAITTENESVYVLSYSNYWKDGTEIIINSHDLSFSPVDIAVSNGQVYLAGDVGNRGHVWHESQVTLLDVPEQIESSRAVCATAAGGSIYIGGYYTIPGGREYPCYWKDGVFSYLSLPQGSKGCRVEKMCTGDDGKVYIAGTYRDSEHRQYFCYWTDGALTDLVSPFVEEPNQIRVKGIAAAGGNVYVAGYFHYYDNYTQYGKVCYWVNYDGAFFVGEEAATLSVAGIAVMRRD